MPSTSTSALGDQVEHGRDRGRVLEVERDARAAPVEQVVRAAGERLAARALDPDHVGAEVGQDHAGVRSGADAGDLDDLDPAQRSGALAQCVAHARRDRRCQLEVGAMSGRSRRTWSVLCECTVTRRGPCPGHHPVLTGTVTTKATPARPGSPEQQVGSPASIARAARITLSTISMTGSRRCRRRSRRTAVGRQLAAYAGEGEQVAEEEGQHDGEHDARRRPAPPGREHHAEHLADGAAGEAVQRRGSRSSR